VKKLILILGILVLLLGMTGCAQGGIPPGQGTTPDQEEYGTPPEGPETEPEIEVPEDYPYLAILPPGAEGKVQLAYNYGENPAGSRLYKMKFTNLSNRTVEEVMISEFAKDKNGKIVQLGGCGGRDIKPGKSWYPGMTGGLAEQDYELYELTPSVTFWPEITYIKFR